MDWPLTGVVAGIAMLTAGASYGVVTLILSDVAVPKQTVESPQLVPRAALPIHLTPGLPRDELTPTAPPLLLNGPVGPFDIRKTNLEADPAPAEIAPTAKARLPNVVKKASPLRLESLPPATVEGVAPVMPKSNASLQTGPLQGAPASPVIAQEKWRVVATENASYFNLGGHINRSGVVDSLASSHLRDTFKAHRNFGKLPPDIRSHIASSENIDLTRIAPYRVLLGINDKKIEEEQAVRFERVASNR
jgi:hypothetical protein